VAQEERRRRRL